MSETRRSGTGQTGAALGKRFRELRRLKSGRARPGLTRSPKKGEKNTDRGEVKLF